MKQSLAPLSVIKYGSLLLLLILGTSVARAQSLKIMPIGDSLTNGYSSPGGYREKLLTNLTADGFNVTFLGDFSDNPSPLLGTNIFHNGVNGATLSYYPGRANLLGAVPGFFASGKPSPDVVLLLAGTNDIDLSIDLVTAPVRLNNLINAIWQKVPNARIIVGTLPHNKGEDRDPMVQAFNEAIIAPGGIIDQQRALGRKVTTVDLYSGISTDDYRDTLHMNKAGYDRMADIWSAAIKGRTIKGTLRLGDGYQGDVGAVPITVSLCRPGTNNAVATETFQTAPDGAYEVGTDLLGTYDLMFSGPHWLVARVPVTLSNFGADAVTVTLVNGDIDHDNVVSILDYGILSDCFDRSDSDSDWSQVGPNGFAPIQADLDGDATVSILDYAIISENFDKTGA